MQEIRNRFTDRLESALTQLSDSNSRYANLLTNHDLTRGELEREKKENICLLQHTEKLEKKVVQLQNDIEEREILVLLNRNLQNNCQNLPHFQFLIGIPKSKKKNY